MDDNQERYPNPAEIRHLIGSQHEVTIQQRDPARSATRH